MLSVIIMKLRNLPYRETDRQTGIHTERQTDRKTDRQTDRQTSPKFAQVKFLHFDDIQLFSH